MDSPLQQDSLYTTDLLALPPKFYRVPRETLFITDCKVLSDRNLSIMLQDIYIYIHIYGPLHLHGGIL